MKLYLLFAFFSTLPVMMAGQTAEEILWQTEGTYRGLTNYVDEGTRISISSAFPFPDTTTYALAMDRNRNVYHWFHKKQRDNINRRTLCKI